MRNLSSLTPAELRRAAKLQEQIEALNHELARILDNPAHQSAPTSKSFKIRKKYKLSAKGRAEKIAAQKARWAKVKAETETEPLKKPRKMSAEGKAKIAAAAKARWAMVKLGRNFK